MQINVLEYLESTLRTRPDAPAIVDGAVTYSFAEMADLARRCGALIGRHTRKQNKPIAVYLPKSAWTVLADLGILYSGNIYTNLDTKAPATRQKKLIENIDPALVITNSSLRDAVLALGIAPDRVLGIEEIAAAPFVPPEDDAAAGQRSRIDTDPMCLISTSGS